MADYTPNNTANVSVGKGLQGGYVLSGPITAELPTGTDWVPGPEFVNLGYISEDGITFSASGNSSTIPDMNGDTVVTSSSGRAETAAFTLIEVMRNALAEVYGQSNVTDEDGMITVLHNSLEHEARVYVFLLLLRDGRKMISVIPNGQVTEIGDLAVNSSNVFGRQITVQALPDENGNNMIDYIESTETVKED